MYDKRTDNLHENYRDSIFNNLFRGLPFFYEYALVGYFQTYRCFQNVENELRTQHFKFHNRLALKAQRFFSENVTNVIGSSRKDMIYVGIDIRRGDMVSKKSLIDKGYTTAHSSYILNAITYYVKRYLTNSIIFIVCTDDKKWFYDNTEGKSNASILLSHGSDPGLDLAILSQCNHSIITVGSFGWWSAWLAGGTTVYYANWPRKGSKLAENFYKEEYFPPHWIPLS